MQVEYHQGFTPLHAAIGEKQTEMVEFLLKHGADPNSTHSAGKSPLYEETPLFGCVLGGHCNVAEYLIDQGADLQIQNKDEWRSLHVATYNNEEDLARLLVDRAASLEVRDNRGMALFTLPRKREMPKFWDAFWSLGQILHPKTTKERRHCTSQQIKNKPA